MVKRRGYREVPNDLYRDNRLSLEHLGLLLSLSSHAPAHVIRADEIQRWYDIGEKKWRKLAGDLRAWGYLETRYAYDENGDRCGLYVRTSLTGRNGSLVEPTNRPKATRSKRQATYKDKYSDPRSIQSFDVIDCDDVVEPYDERFDTDG
ncbi:MAG: hypothetical protein KDK24_16930 [Pseudooceanicola sp.]|nr:hypothetical protein [Pseudooceanicola sp.]